MRNTREHTDAFLEKIPAEWSEFTKSMIDVYGQKILRSARYDDEAFGSFVIVFGKSLVRIRLIRDRSTVSVDSKWLFGALWHPFASLHSFMAGEHLDMTPDRVQRIVCSWSCKDWRRAMWSLLMNGNKIYSISKKNNVYID